MLQALNRSLSIRKFFGIRYAAPPVGELRWRPPLNTEEIQYIAPEATKDATKPGPVCIQGLPAWMKVDLSTFANASEDCLLLDVSVPVTPASSAPLPVMVQIHGGGFTVGSASLYSGDALMTHSKGSMIYVSIQYRLGPYGFLSSGAVKADGSPNVGLLDQRAALEWVKGHISSFGGDPDRVTIIGGSAGGGSVTAQMMLWGGAPGNDKPPFAAAIAGK
jgi:carboxylesterase type B